MAFVCPQTTITANFVVTAVSNVGAVTADRALRSRLFRVGVRLGAQLKLITYRCCMPLNIPIETNRTKIGVYMPPGYMELHRIVVFS